MDPVSSIAASFGIPVWLLLLVLIWSMVWMAIGMWKAARKNHLIWFIVFLLVHTIGILEILYVFVLSEVKRKPEIPVAARRKKI